MDTEAEKHTSWQYAVAEDEQELKCAIKNGATKLSQIRCTTALDYQ